MHDKQCVVALSELAGAMEKLPKISQWDESACATFDIFVTALGFEDRSTHVPQTLSTLIGDGVVPRASVAVVARYDTNATDNARNDGALDKALSIISERTEYIEADSPHSVDRDLGGLVDAMNAAKGHVRIALDISAASGSLILSVMHTLLQRAKSVDLLVFYVEPESYHPSRMDYDRNPDGVVSLCCAVGNPDSLHEYGVEVVQVNELYPGFGVENRPEFVIAIPSFRTERLRYCLQYVGDQVQAAPDRYVRWLLGCPPAESNRWRYDLQRRVINRMMATMVGREPGDDQAPILGEKNCHLVSTLDYREMVEQIILSADEHIGDRISVIHMGSKMQAVGLALALGVRREIAVCYARPTGFNPSQYSSGCSTSWIVQFGTLGPIVDELVQVGELKLTTTIETDRTGLQSIR